jgi:hypothetical protein
VSVDRRESLALLPGHGKMGAHNRAEVASLTGLIELSTRLTATSGLPSILYEILDATIELQGADFGDVQLYDRGLDTDFLATSQLSTPRKRRLAVSRCAQGPA